MQFADLSVEQAVMDILDCNFADVELQHGTVQELYIKGMKSLKDLLRFPKLYHLCISDSFIEDPEILSKLIQLTELTLLMY